MAGVDQSKGIKLLNNILKDLGIYKRGQVEGDIQDFTSIFAQAEDSNGDGQIDVKEFTQALAGYAEYNFDPNSLTQDQLDEIGDDYSTLFEQIFGEDGASASEISNLSNDVGSSAAGRGYTSDTTTMDDVKTRFNPTIQEANTENMSLADMKSNLAASEKALSDKQTEIQNTQKANEQAYVEALDKAAENNKALEKLKGTRDEKEGLVQDQDNIIGEIGEQVGVQDQIIADQDAIIADCETIINTPIPSPQKDPKTGEITNQAEIDKIKADIQTAKGKKAEAEAAKQTAEQNKLDLEAKKVAAEEQKLVLEAEILDIDKQVEAEIKNNTELQDLAKKLEAYKDANMQIMSMEADRVQLEKNINIYEKAIFDAEMAEDPVTEKETTGLLEESDTFKDEEGNYIYDVKTDDTLESVVETNYDIAALVEATGLERSEVIDKLAEQLNTSNGIGESGVIYPGTTLTMVDAYAALGVQDKRPVASDGVDPNAKRDLDDTQIDGVVDYLLGDIDIDGIDIDPQEAWNNHDFSQYTPETLAKIAAAYEEKVGAADVSFLEMAELNIEAEDKLAEIAGSMISAATSDGVDPTVKARALEMVNTHIDDAIESGDPTFLQAIINSPGEYLTDVQEFIDSSGLMDKLFNSEHEEISELRDEFRDKQNEVYISPEMQEQLNKLLSTDPDISTEAWNALDLSNPDAIADLQHEYDAQRKPGDPTFLEKAAEMYGKSEMDEILEQMDKLPEDPAETADDEIKINGKTQTVEDIVEELQSSKDFSILAGLKTEDLAKIAKVYGNMDQFEFLMEHEGIADPATGYTDVRRATEARADEIADRNDDYENKDEQLAYDKVVDDAYAGLEEKLNEFNESNARLEASGLNPNDDEQIFAEINKTMNDSSLTLEQKADVLQKLSENEAFAPYVQGFLTNEDNNSDQLVTRILGDCSTPEEAAEFATWYNSVVDPNNVGDAHISDLMTSPANINTLVELYEKATPEQIAVLNDTFDMTTILDSLKRKERDQAERLFSAMIPDNEEFVPNVEINGEVQEFTADEQKALKDKFIISDGFLRDGSNKTVDGILDAFDNGTINKATAAWLLVESGYDFKELYFDNCNDDQKQVLLELFE